MRYSLDDGITADVSPRAIVCDIACPRLAVLKSHDYRLAFGWWFISRLPCADFSDKTRSRLYRADISRFSVASYQFIWFVNYCGIHTIAVMPEAFCLRWLVFWTFPSRFSSEMRGRIERMLKQSAAAISSAVIPAGCFFRVSSAMPCSRLLSILSAASALVPPALLPAKVG